MHLSLQEEEWLESGVAKNLTEVKTTKGKPSQITKKFDY